MAGEIPQFIFELGKVAGSLGNEKIKKYLTDLGATDIEIDAAQKGLFKIADYLYKKEEKN